MHALALVIICLLAVRVAGVDIRLDDVDENTPVDLVPVDENAPFDAPAETSEPAVVTFAPLTPVPTVEPTPPPTPLPTPESTNAPHGTVPPGTGAPVTPTPAAVSSVSWCSEDADCRGWGDSNATCASNKSCVCSAGFVHPEQGDIKAGTCVVPSDVPGYMTRKVRVRVDGVFPGGICAQFKNLEGRFEAIWKKAFGVSVLNAVYGCGSVYFSVTSSEVPNKVIADSRSVAAEVNSGVAADTDLHAALGDGMVVSMVLGSSVVACPMDGALVTANVNNICKALTCDYNYDLVTTDSSSYCKKQSSSSSSNTGTILAVAIGAGAALIVVLTCVYCTRRKKHKNLEPDEEMDDRSPDDTGAL